MCGRFVLHCDLDEIKDVFAVEEIQGTFEPSFNIAPGQDIAAVVDSGRNKLIKLRWGLVPSWSKEAPGREARMINARAETIQEKPSFARLFKNRRCLIPASGFYEWRVVSDKKVPVFVRLASQRLFPFAGLYDIWHGPGGETVVSGTIITTEPNELLAPIHNRMPVILPLSAAGAWLNPAASPSELQKLLKPFPASAMTVYEVSRRVNSPKFNQPEAIKPVPSAGDLPYDDQKSSER